MTESNYDGVNTSLLTRVASGDAPDVAQVSNQWVAAYVEMDVVMSLEELFDKVVIADFYTGSMEGTLFDEFYNDCALFNIIKDHQQHAKLRAVFSDLDKQ